MADGIFRNYMQGQQLGMAQGLSMLQRDELMRKMQREGQMRNILAEAYRPAVAAAAPELQVGPVMPGETMPYEAQAAGGGMPEALTEMYRQGLGPEAMAYEKSMLTAGGQAPAAVREYQYYQGLKSPDEQAAFMAIKRGSQVQKIGGVWHERDPVTGQWVPLSTVQQEAAGQAEIASTKKAAELFASTKAAAVDQLPAAELSAEKTTAKIDELLKHPGLDANFGVKSYLPVVRGTPRADFQNLLEQLQSSIFIDNRAKLKGGGSITDYEGRQAAQAEVALGQAVSADQFRKSLQDYQYWVNRGLEKLRAKAGKPTEAPQAAIDFLKKNNTPAVRKQFLDKYKYLPEGY